MPVGVHHDHPITVLKFEKSTTVIILRHISQISFIPVFKNIKLLIRASY